MCKRVCFWLPLWCQSLVVVSWTVIQLDDLTASNKPVIYSRSSLCRYGQPWHWNSSTGRLNHLLGVGEEDERWIVEYLVVKTTCCQQIDAEKGLEVPFIFYRAQCTWPEITAYVYSIVFCSVLLGDIKSVSNLGIKQQFSCFILGSRFLAAAFFE